MANITLGWNNRTDSGTLSGGSWQSTLPLSNLQNRQVQKVARSTDATTASTQFQIDLGQARPIGVVGLIVHNIGVTGKVRITGADSPASFTNLTTFPTDIDNGAWGKTGVTVNANVAVAPDGTTTADAVMETATTGTHFIAQNITTVIGINAVEAYVKANGRTRGYIQIFGTGGNSVCRFDLSTGTVVSGGLGTNSVVDAGDGWYKVTSYMNFTSTSNAVYVALEDASGNASYTGSTSAGLYVWGVRAYNNVPTWFDSGWVSAWPAGQIPQSLLEWEEDNFWLGTLSASARAAYQSPYIYPMSTQSLRYWRVEIADIGNQDGYVQIGRLFMSSTWTPSVNYSYGAGLGYQDPTPIDTSLSGAEYFDVRSKFRVFSFSLEYILGTEAYAYALDLQRVSGTSGEVLVVADADDTTNGPARSFVGRLTQIGQIQQTQPSAYSVQFQLKELL